MGSSRRSLNRSCMTRMGGSRCGQGSSNEYRVGAVEGYAGDASSKMLTEIEILKSDSLMLRVCREMDLSNNADFLEPRSGRSAHAPWTMERPGKRRFIGCRAICTLRWFRRRILSASATAA